MTTQHYQGSCQCGAVRWDVDVDLSNTITCNCSRCKRMGFVLAFAPRQAFRLHSGADQLTEYLFHERVIRHQFCRNCGVEGFAHGQNPDGSAVVAINVNCLDDVDPGSLHSQPVDGRSF